MDELTLQRAREGDRAARERLLRELQDPWYRLCLSLLRDADLACDATQETALRFLRRLSDFRGDSSVTTWSMGIAINVVREMRRRRAALGETREPSIARTMSISTVAADGTLPPEARASPRASILHGPEQFAANSESAGILHDVLRGLPERQREAIVLRFFQELSVEETATAMNCAAGTVKATVHQALRALRARLPQLRP